MIKRAIDIILSSLSLIICSPLLLCIFIGLRLTSKDSAIFSQERIGRGGKPFMILKFRTMIVDSEKDSVPKLTDIDDERLTTFGRFLRAHHLDELPQLWNVLRGDMSLIGYRPERKFFIDQIMEHDPRYSLLYRIQPGVTSYATLYNGYTDTMEKMLKRLELDLYYLENHSFWMDAKILWLTFCNIIRGKKF